MLSSCLPGDGLVVGILVGLAGLGDQLFLHVGANEVFNAVSGFVHMVGSVSYTHLRAHET